VSRREDARPGALAGLARTSPAAASSRARLARSSSRRRWSASASRASSARTCAAARARVGARAGRRAPRARARRGGRTCAWLRRAARACRRSAARMSGAAVARTSCTSRPSACARARRVGGGSPLRRAAAPRGRARAWPRPWQLTTPAGVARQPSCAPNARPPSRCGAPGSRAACSQCPPALPQRGRRERRGAEPCSPGDRPARAPERAEADAVAVARDQEHGLRRVVRQAQRACAVAAGRQGRAPRRCRAAGPPDAPPSLAAWRSGSATARRSQPRRLRSAVTSSPAGVKKTTTCSVPASAGHRGGRGAACAGAAARGPHRARLQQARGQDLAAGRTAGAAGLARRGIGVRGRAARAARRGQALAQPARRVLRRRAWRRRPCVLLLLAPPAGGSPARRCCARAGQRGAASDGARAWRPCAGRCTPPRRCPASTAAASRGGGLAVGWATGGVLSGACGHR